MLFAPVLRDLVLGLADAGLFQPLWSEGVAAEWLHVSAEPGAADRLARMAARWPEGLAPAGAPELLDLPDAADRHVLAAAIAGRAEVLLTANLRDFPRRALAHHGIRAEAPDAFVMALWLADRGPVEAQVARVWPGLAGDDLRRAMKRATLPRLGKALAG